MNGGRFVVRASGREAAGAALALAVLLALRLFQGLEAFTRRDEGAWWALPHLAEAGLLAAALLGTLYYLITRRPIVTVGPEGISARAHGPETIPWAAIDAAWQEGEDTLCLRLRDPARYPRAWWRRWQRRPKGADVAIRLRHAKAELDGLIDAVAHYRPRAFDQA